MRLVLITCVSIYLRNVVVVQTLLVSLSIIMMMSMVGFFRPVANPFGLLIDEFVTISVLDLLFFSTDPALDEDQRVYLGWLQIVVLGSTIIVNIGWLFIKSAINLTNVCRHKWRTFWHKRARRKLKKSKKSKVDNEKEQNGLSAFIEMHNDGRRRRRLQPRK